MRNHIFFLIEKKNYEENIWFHDFGPFYWLVAQLDLIPCTRIPSVTLSHAFLLNISKWLCTPKYKVVALKNCNHIQNLLKIRRNMLFMVAGLLLARDISYKSLPSFIDGKQYCRCKTEVCCWFRYFHFWKYC